MEYNDIKNSNLQTKSKKEIIEFLCNALTEFNLNVEFEMLQQFLSAEHFEKIENFVEKDTRDDINENSPEMEESEISEWVESDKIRRPMEFIKNKEGKVMITDPTSRMQENPEIADLNPEEFNIAALVELVRQGILYKQTHVGYREELSSARALEELENQLKRLSVELRDLDSIKRRAISGDSLKIYCLRL